MQSISSDTLVTLKSLLGFHKSYMGHEKPAKSLVPHTPEGLGAAQFRACTCVVVLECCHTCRTGLPARQTTPAIVFAVCGDVAYLSNKSACKTGLMKGQNEAEECKCITVM
jgi:hypothetical protein